MDSALPARGAFDRSTAREVLEALPDAVFVHDVATHRLLASNKRAELFFGVDPGEMPRLVIEHFSAEPPEFTRMVIGGYLEALERGDAVPSLEWTVVHGDGRRFWVDVAFSLAEMGGKRCIVLVLRDVSERRVESLNRLYVVLSEVERVSTSAADRLAMLTEICEIVTTVGAYAGAAFVVDDESGLRVVDQSGVPFSAADVEAAFACSGGRCLTALVEHETTLCARERVRGGCRWLPSSALRACAFIPLPRQSAALVVGSNEDGAFGRAEVDLLQQVVATVEFTLNHQATAQRQREAERALEDERRKLERIANTSPVGIVMLDVRGRFAWLNARAEEIYGVRAGTLFDLLPLDEAWPFVDVDGHPFDPCAAPFTRARAHQLSVFDVHVAAVRRRDGATLRLSINCAPLVDEGGEFQGAVLTIDDVTESHLARAAEAAMLRSKEVAESASEAKSRFLANMSHEIRTPLNAILGFAQLLSGKVNLDPEQRSHIEAIQRGGEHLLELINDVLEMSKIEAGHLVLNPVFFDLHLLFRELDHLFRGRAQAHGLKLDLVLSPQVPHHVEADKARLRQVVANLLANAIKFTDHGSVSLHVDVEPTPEALYLLVEVRDTGRGISPEQMSRLFRYFEQATPGRESGTGLGLALSRELCHLMGGTIGVESEVGVGSCFHCRVPVLELEAPGGPAHSASARRLQDGQPPCRVLVVDDVEPNRRVLAEMLLRAGFVVKEADGGRAALEEVEAFDPEVLLLDMRMPGLDGFEVARRLRARQGARPVRVIAVTASAFAEEHARMLEAGVDEVVHKPFRLDDVLDRICRATGRSLVEAPQEHPSGEHDLGAVRRLDAGLRAHLRELVIHADADALAGQIDDLRRVDGAAAEVIAAMVENFDYEQLLMLLG